MDVGSSWTSSVVLRAGGCFVLGGLITCSGIVSSVNPVTIKVADMARNFFSSHGALAGELVLKLSGLIFSAIFTYYTANGFDSSQDKISIIAGAAFAALFDTTAYIIAAVHELPKDLFAHT